MLLSNSPPPITPAAVDAAVPRNDPPEPKAGPITLWRLKSHIGDSICSRRNREAFNAPQPVNGIPQQSCRNLIGNLNLPRKIRLITAFPVLPGLTRSRDGLSRV